MATPKTHVPQAAAFQSDPTEQIFSKGVLDREMSGLSYMFLNAAQQRREAGQQDYMTGLQEANKIAAALAREEEMNKRAMETLKQAVEMSKMGTAPSAMSIMQLLSGGNDIDAAPAAKLALMQSEAAANNAKAVASGKEGQDQFTYEVDMAQGGPVSGTWKGKGRDPAAIERKLHELAERDKIARRPGGKLSLDGAASPLTAEMLQQLAARKARGGQ